MKNKVKLGMIVRVDYGPCGRVMEIDNERSSYPYKVRYSRGLAEWASANQMEEILDAPDESAPCAEGTDENDDVIEPCNTCTHRDNLRCNPPCSHCRQERGIEYPEYEEAEEDEEDVLPPCSTCKYGDLPGTVGPCASCFDEGLDHPLNYEEATESGDEGTVGSGIKGIVPQHIVDMFTERVKQAALRFVNECNAHPRPCPYCGEIPEVVEEAIYPGEKHCYVVCNGAKLLPHSISIHGRTREEAAAHWNSFVLTMKSQEK